MGPKRAPDCRSLIPRTPPEGLREWVLHTQAGALERGGLLYAVEYAEDFGLACILDACARPRRIKMVRVVCSSCGGSVLLDWAKDADHGYGFVHPNDAEGNPTVTVSGDESVCPLCGAPVLVRKRAEVRDFFVAAETACMSASLAGEDHWLVLTGWCVQRRVYQSGRESLEFLPMEAYIFGPHECVQLMGWRDGYSGRGGYFVQFSRQWRQPRYWNDRWGQEEHMFGLTPELLARSALPHCKLDVYMAARPGARHYPVTYLRLYQAHPNVESLLLHGLPRVLDDLIIREDRPWDRPRLGALELPAIDWAQSRPAQMLCLTKDELRMARRQDWGLFLWKLFTAVKRSGERLTEEELRDAFRLGDEHLSLLALRGQAGKSIRYLARQWEALGQAVGQAVDGADPVPDTQILMDYWAMAETLGWDLSDPAVKYPQDLIGAHDRAAEQMKARSAANRANLFRLRRRTLRKYAFASGGLLIRPAASQRELTEEGNALHHCVGTYGKRHADGETAIFFIRRTCQPGTPYFTLELDEGALTVRQNRGKYNGPRTPEVEAFEHQWLAWVRAGAPRDRNGKPAVPAAKPGRECVA